MQIFISNEQFFFYLFPVRRKQVSTNRHVQFHSKFRVLLWSISLLKKSILTLCVPELHFCLNQYDFKRPQSYIFKYPAPLHKTPVSYSYNRTKQKFFTQT